MTEQMVDAPPLAAPRLPDERTPSGAGTPGSRLTPAQVVQRYPWWFTAAGLLLLSTVVVLWAKTRPGYDPYGWLVWGHLTIHWALDTNGAPSWKPMPFLFTVPFAVFGHYAVWLWMVFSVAVSLSGIIFAWRIAFRLTGAEPQRRYASYVAGATAAAALLLITNYTHFILSSQSDTMIVATCLGAIDCQLSGRLRWAFALWWLGSLGRPEVWPFLGLFSVWAWRTHPHMRRLVAGGLILVPALWFGIPALTAKSAFIAGDNALRSPRELHGNKITGTISRFIALNAAPIWLASLVALAVAAVRRRWSVLLIGAGVVLWVVVEIAFALHGWPAVPRYLFEAAGGAAVLAGLAVGFAILELPRLLRRLRARLITQQVAGWATAVLVLAFFGTLLSTAHTRYRVERKDLNHERARTRQIGRLAKVVGILGAKNIMACGQPNIPIQYQSVLALDLGVRIGALYFNPHYTKLHPHPVVNIYPHTNGWKVFPSHLTAASPTQCHRLHLTYSS